MPDITRGEILRRILTLIDVMAARRRPATVAELVEEVNGRLFRKYNARTIRRDLLILWESGLAERIETESQFKPDQWRLNLKRTEGYQRLAIEAAGG